MPESTTTFSVEAAGQVYSQANEFVYLGGNVNDDVDLSIEVDQRIRNAWCSFRKYTLELYDRPSAPLGLRIRILRAEVLETMLYGCVTWSPHVCHYGTLRRDSFLACCIGWRKNNHNDQPISYLDPLMNKKSESIDAIICRRRILSAGFVARMENLRLPRCVMFVELVGGAGCVGGAGKRVDGVSPGRFQRFWYQRRPVDDCSPDEREWRKTTEQGTESFTAKWIAAEKARARLRHAVVYPNVTGRTKERIAESKNYCAVSLAIVD